MFTEFIIDRIEPESSNIKSFYLKRSDGQPVETYFPGQFITLRIKQDAADKELLRNYTLSDSPGKDYFRLTIKREENGRVSPYFHDVLQEGDKIEVSSPSGNFYLSTDTNKPVMLLSGGVGITPMMSMAEYLISHQSTRHVFFLHASRKKEVQPMLSRLRDMASQNPAFHLALFHTQPSPNEQPNLDYDYPGFITKARLQQILPSEDIAVYLCGPVSFMETMHSHLTDLGVSEDNIYYEFFGEGKGLSNKPTMAVSRTDTEAFRIKFTRSNIEVIWNKQQPSILELAEWAGLSPAYSCRMGTCATCEASLVKGAIEYDPEPFMEIPEGKVLLCCSKPVSDLEIDI